MIGEPDAILHVFQVDDHFLVIAWDGDAVLPPICLHKLDWFKRLVDRGPEQGYDPATEANIYSTLGHAFINQAQRIMADRN